MTFYIEPFIPIPFVSINTLRVSGRDTPSFDTPLVTDYGEGTCQKILIDLEGVLPKRFFTFVKNSSKRLGKHLQGTTKFLSRLE